MFGSPIEDIGGVPQCSPDLSAIENIFGHWQHQVHQMNPKTTEELINCNQRMEQNSSRYDQENNDPYGSCL